jgi:hypothetical protein
MALKENLKFGSALAGRCLGAAHNTQTGNIGAQPGPTANIA